MSVEFIPICVQKDEIGSFLVVNYFVPPGGYSIDRVGDELDPSKNIRYTQCHLPDTRPALPNALARVENTFVKAFAAQECKTCPLNVVCDQVSNEMLRRLP